MRIWYDTEFLERGSTEAIWPISIGMVREDGAELYLVNGSLDIRQLSVIRNHPWLGPNVYAHLPQTDGYEYAPPEGWPKDMSPPQPLDYNNDVVVSLGEMAEKVADFCYEGLAGSNPPYKAELWAWYADYDHVVLSQLFGSMVNLPAHMPMYTRDLKQAVDTLDRQWQLGQLHITRSRKLIAEGTPLGALMSPFNDAVSRIPETDEHHALADARHVREMYEAATALLGNLL